MAAPLVVVTGPPGGGKTTVSRRVAARFSPVACVLESDWWWTTIVTGAIDPWLPGAHEQNRTVVRSFSAAARVMREGGYPTVLDGVVLPGMLDLVTAGLGEPVHYVVLRPGLEETLHRAATRPRDERVPGHPPLSDEAALRHLWEQFSDLGAYEPHVLDTTALDVEETSAAVWDLLQRDAVRLGAR